MQYLIIDNYDSFTFNLYQLISLVAQKEVIVKRNDEITLEQIKELNPAGIILSPGPGHPAQSRDFGVCKDVVSLAPELKCPILGVCLGHQGIVQHSGGNVVRAPHPVHGKMSKINIVAKSPLFTGISSGTKVMRYHSLIAERSTMPSSLEVLAELEDDSDIVMALQDRKGKMFGLQFHPESVGTELGKKILENFIALC
ncbi:MAG: aminodeoxychorismate/anthranilate synthase component II [Candidatus Obscuribacterales bacterium]|nr:aminodeoxychorismate/anthranilate synthase component II [Candidatus Obscuribacterales bacterium]